MSPIPALPTPPGDALPPLHPWDRLPGESPKAYAAFCYYRDLGAHRSLRLAFATWTRDRDHARSGAPVAALPPLPPTGTEPAPDRTGTQPGGNGVTDKLAAPERTKSAPSWWQEWSAQFSWVERARAWDADQVAHVVRAQEEALARQAAVWAARQEEERQREWDLAAKLVQKAQSMLDFPLAEVRTEAKRTETADGKTIIYQTTVYEPGKWGMRDAALMGDVAQKLARLSTGMALASEDRGRGAEPVVAESNPSGGRREAALQSRLARALHLADDAQRNALINAYERMTAAARELDTLLAEVETPEPPGVVRTVTVAPVAAEGH